MNEAKRKELVRVIQKDVKESGGAHWPFPSGEAHAIVDAIAPWLEQQVNEAVLAEREACARVCEDKLETNGEVWDTAERTCMALAGYIRRRIGAEQREKEGK